MRSVAGKFLVTQDEPCSKSLKAHPDSMAELAQATGRQAKKMSRDIPYFRYFIFQKVATIIFSPTPNLKFHETGVHSGIAALIPQRLTTEI
jgi:hypothetical protein